MTYQDDLSAANAHLQRGQFKSALKSAKAAIKKQPKSAVAANMAGIALSRTGKLRDAVPMFQKAARLDPGLSDAPRNLAQTLILLDRPDLARPVLMRLTEKMPQDGDAWYLLAQAELALQNTAAAEAAATRSIAAVPGQSRALNLRGLLRDRMGALPEAIADFEAALQANPNDVDALVNISLPLARQMRTDDALAAVRRAVALAPDHVGAGLRLAMQYVESGQTDQAIAEFRRVLAISPDQPEAIEQLAGLQDSVANSALEPMALAALKAEKRDAAARASLSFALARIAQQDGRADEANHLADANRAMASRLPYDAAADSVLNDGLLSRFPAQPTPASIEPDDGPRPIFVVGLPRSGTTLTEAILGAHPDVAALGERAAAGILLQQVISENLPFDTDAIRTFIDGDRRMLPPLPDGTRFYVDKMPENYRLLGFLLTAYPDARVINLTRDPRDAALSMWRGHFSGTALSYTYDLQAMAHRFNLYAQSMAHWRKVFQGAILDLSYEDLVRDVEATSRQLADFCGLDWAPAMARPDQAAGQVLTLSASQVRQPVHTRSIEKWRQHQEMLTPFVAGLDPDLWPVVKTG